MGSFVFKWEHPAEEVYVTGTFDDWTKSVKLDKIDGVFQKEVNLKNASRKIYYKFVVDGNWTTNQSAPQEVDPSNNVNNVLVPEHIMTDKAAVMSTVGPDSTTAALAGQVPLEEKKDDLQPDITPSDVPGGFPETPANELDKIFAVNPLPATVGAVNPVDLAPGEPLSVMPEAGDRIHEHVKLDEDSYEKADALPGLDGFPPVSDSMIPESSLPIVQNAISTVHPGATTAQLAGEVPLEPAVPAVVRESQEKAHADPEASADPAEVREKAVVENELLSKVAPAPSSSEGTAGIGTEKSENSTGAAALAATAGGAVLASAVAAKDAVVERAAPVVDQVAASAAAAAAGLPAAVRDALPASVQAAIAARSEEEKIEEVSPRVPAEVRDSIAEAGSRPEAAASTRAVEAKKEVESELLKVVEPAEQVGSEKKSEPEPEETKSDVKSAEAESDVKPAESKYDVKPAEPKSDVKPAEPKSDVKPAVEFETTTPAIITTTNTTPAATSAAYPSGSAPAPALPTNGASNGTGHAADTADTSAKPDEPGAPAAEQAKTDGSGSLKKKNRISVMFNKIKQKFSHSHSGEKKVESA